jgi:hypothetical protein
MSTGLPGMSALMVAMFGTVALTVALEPIVPASPTQLLLSFQSPLTSPSQTVASAEELRTAEPATRRANQRVF